MLQIDFYYWSFQCPISNETIELFKKYRNKATINLYDISENPDFAHKYNIFFPFLTIVNQTTRLFAPITETILNELLENDGTIEETPHIIEFGTTKFCGELVPLTKENISLLSKKCTLTDCINSCKQKGDFLGKKGDSIFGYLNLKDGEVLGGVEYVPSLLVPYGIPKDEKTAFLTCLYPSSSDYDYKAYPLESLEEKLKQDYQRVVAICDKIGTFPNGNLPWFLKQGYIDEGIISIEEGYCTLHLVSKML